jgi:hypothetical protein
MDLYRFYLEKTCLIDISKLILNKFSKNIHGENTPLMHSLFYYEPTATWTDKNGAKTKKLWAKQDCRDQSAINYRLQGLAEKKPETQQTVLAKRSKSRVKAEIVLELGLIAGI